jgi:flagellar basal body-associated protein FliL
MAEEKKQQKVEAPKNPKALKDPKDPEEPQEEGEKKNLLKIIILVVLVLVIAGGSTAGYFFYGNKIMQKYLNKKPPESTEQTEQREQKEGTEKKKEDVGPILSLEPFIFNMSGNQSKYAKVTLGVEFKDPKAMEEAKKMTPVIRDRILSILGTKAPEVLMDVNQRNTIKDEIQASLRTLFKDDADLRGVYITDIIIQ